MINSKSELKRKLAENKDGIKFMTIENHCKEGFMVGVVRNVGTQIQTNAFTIETVKDNGAKIDSWTWYKDIDVKDNMIIYKSGDVKIKILEEK
ncbi:MAG: hypothetical protein ACI31S_01395 [Bacilli bacterium]